MRKPYSATYKAEIVKEILREEKTLNQLASETGIRPTQLKEWKKRSLEKLPELFSRSDRVADELRLHEEQVDKLHYTDQPNALRLCHLTASICGLKVSFDGSRIGLPSSSRRGKF
jgi:transposase